MPLEIKREIDPALEKELMKSNRKLREDFLWIFANEDKLREKYANKYIAVNNKRVVFADDTMKDIITEINSAKKQLQDFAIQFITDKPVNFLF